MANSNDSDPIHHTQKMQQRLEDIIVHLRIVHLRQDIDKVDEAQFKAMFETSAEVLFGLIKAFVTTNKRPSGLGSHRAKQVAGDRIGSCLVDSLALLSAMGCVTPISRQ